MKVNIGKYKKRRTISIKMEKHDLWDFWGSTGLIILEWLKEFRNCDRQGVPADVLMNMRIADKDDFQSSFDFYKETSPQFSQAEDKWNEIIDKMIWSFEQMTNETNADYWTETDLDLFNRFKYDQYQNRIEEGLDLFRKYMEYLWY